MTICDRIQFNTDLMTCYAQAHETWKTPAQSIAAGQGDSQIDA